MIKNDNSSPKLTHLQNKLLMRIFEALKNYLSHGEGKPVTRKVHSSSTLFLCSVRTIYNRVHCELNKSLMLKSYIPVIDSWIGYNFFENLVNELHERIEKKIHIIPPPNVSDSICVKFNGNESNKRNYFIKISLREFYNDIILPVSQGVFLVL